MKEGNDEEEEDEEEDMWSGAERSVHDALYLAPRSDVYAGGHHYPNDAQGRMFETHDGRTRTWTPWVALRFGNVTFMTNAEAAKNDADLWAVRVIEGHKHVTESVCLGPLPEEARGGEFPRHVLTRYAYQLRPKLHAAAASNGGKLLFEIRPRG